MGLLTRSRNKGPEPTIALPLNPADTPLPKRESKDVAARQRTQAGGDDSRWAPPTGQVAAPQLHSFQSPISEVPPPPRDLVIGRPIGANQDRSFDTAVLSVLEIDGPADRLLHAFEDFNRHTATRPAGQLLHGCSQTVRGIVVYDLWASTAALEEWLAATPGSPKPQVTFLRGVRVVDPSTWVSMSVAVTGESGETEQGFGPG